MSSDWHMRASSTRNHDKHPPPCVSLLRHLTMLGMLVLLPGLITCTRAAIEEGSEPGDCTDGADNDADSLYDCDDPGCAADPECVVLPGDDDDDSSSSGCNAGEMLDCNANCAPTEWLGDGQCDDGAYPYYGNLIDYACAEHGFDNGDCEATGDDDDTGDDDTADDDDSAVEPWTFPEIYAFVATNCSCHSNSAHESGFAFDASQTTLYEVWVGSDGSGTLASQHSSMKRIEPGDSTQSYVMHKLEGTHISAGGGGSRMPLGGPFLSEDALDGIRGWIDSGASDGQ